MPPHCDSLDGPVVTAARQALEAQDVTLVLPFVPADAEEEVRAAFGRALTVRGLGPDAQETADLLFFETVVRLHRAGEGAPYTGLKPAGLPTGRALELAEQAVDQGTSEALAAFLGEVLRDELQSRLATVEALAADRRRSVADARRYVEAMLGFEVYSHHVFETLTAPRHGESGHGREPAHAGHAAHG